MQGPALEPPRHSSSGQLWPSWQWVCSGGWSEQIDSHAILLLSDKYDLIRKEHEMSESVYKVIELVGTSTESWEKAGAAAVEKAAKSLKDFHSNPS